MNIRKTLLRILAPSPPRCRWPVTNTPTARGSHHSDRSSARTRIDSSSRTTLPLKFRPTLWLLATPAVSSALVGLGTWSAWSGELVSAVLLISLGLLSLVPFLLDFRFYEATEAGVRITRFRGSRFYAFSEMGRLQGGQVSQAPTIVGTSGTGRVNSHSVVDHDGQLLFRIGLTTADRDQLVRLIREELRQRTNR